MDGNSYLLFIYLSRSHSSPSLRGGPLWFGRQTHSGVTHTTDCNEMDHQKGIKYQRSTGYQQIANGKNSQAVIRFGSFQKVKSLSKKNPITLSAEAQLAIRDAGELPRYCGTTDSKTTLEEHTLCVCFCTQSLPGGKTSQPPNIIYIQETVRGSRARPYRSIGPLPVIHSD